jgi:four helix bundle protein
MPIRRFEDLIAWQKARGLTKEIYLVTSSGNFARDRGLCDQMRRAAVSVMSNIAEGFDRGGRAEFHRFLVISKGSCAELRSQLYVAMDAGYLTAEVSTRLLAMIEELGRVIAGLRQAVERQRDRKSK